MIHHSNFRVRIFFLKFSHILSNIADKIKIKKIRLGNVKLSTKIGSFIKRILHLGLPDYLYVNGMEMYYKTPDHRSMWSWLYVLNYECETKHLFEKIIKPGMTFVDVGAHIGYYTLLCGKLVGECGRVYAFEPDPAYYVLLEKNIRKNGLGRTTKAFNFAIGNEKKNVTLFLGRSTSTSIFKVPDSTGEICRTNMVTLDDFFSELNWAQVDIIKIDIEGSEKIALEGMSRLVEKNNNIKVILEINPLMLKNGGTSDVEVLKYLRKSGFNRFKILSNQRDDYEISDNSILESCRQQGYINLFCEIS